MACGVRRRLRYKDLDVVEMPDNGDLARGTIEQLVWRRALVCDGQPLYWASSTFTRRPMEGIPGVVSAAQAVWSLLTGLLRIVGRDSIPLSIRRLILC